VLRRPSSIDLFREAKKCLLQQILRGAVVPRRSTKEVVELGVIRLERRADHAVEAERCRRGSRVDLDESGPHRIRHLRLWKRVTDGNVPRPRSISWPDPIRAFVASGI
jgi:hypothetical protein